MVFSAIFMNTMTKLTQYDFFYNISGAYTWVAPVTGIININAIGGYGGSSGTALGGSNVIIIGTTAVTAKNTYNIFVASPGTSRASAAGDGGGATAFTYKYSPTSNTIICISAGGGGAGNFGVNNIGGTASLPNAVGGTGGSGVAGYGGSGGPQTGAIGGAAGTSSIGTRGTIYGSNFGGNGGYGNALETGTRPYGYGYGGLGDTITATTTARSGGGGGGYYGGGGGSSGAGGGGGSSFTAITFTKSLSSLIFTNPLINMRYTTFTFNTPGAYTWVAPFGGLATLTVAGARGSLVNGRTPGNGAIISGLYTIVANTSYNIYVAAPAVPGTGNGGGGSAFTIKYSPNSNINIIIAGGGGGSGTQSGANGGNAGLITNNGSGTAGGFSNPGQPGTNLAPGISGGSPATGGTLTGSNFGGNGGDASITSYTGSTYGYGYGGYGTGSASPGGGGGGGGYNGGGGSRVGTNAGGGGGASSYVSPLVLFPSGEANSTLTTYINIEYYRTSTFSETYSLWVAPVSGYATITLVGGSGGAQIGGEMGGYGGQIVGTVFLTKNTIYTVYRGKQGLSNSNSGGGGGGSAIYIGNTFNITTSGIMVAGGGGGGAGPNSQNGNGGNGGTSPNGNGARGGNSGGYGATQSNAGAAEAGTATSGTAWDATSPSIGGVGGNGANTPIGGAGGFGFGNGGTGYADGGGGGGGLYGGGGGGKELGVNRGGGGGSSWYNRNLVINVTYSTPATFSDGSVTITYL
jgi:hypothetical protein